MNISDLFIRRRITTTLLAGSICGFGLLSYVSLPMSNLPEVEYPTIRVSAGLAGANPDTMASTVATPLESELSTIPGVVNMVSSSSAGQSDITLEFNLDRSVDGAAQDVQAALSRAQGALPADMPSPPSYSKVNPATEPFLWLEMNSSTLSYYDFARYANQVVAKRIAMVDGVSQVRVYGPDSPAIRVQVDPIRLAAYGTDLEQVRTAVGSNTVTLPAGTLYGASHDYSLATNGQMTTASQFLQLVVGYRNGMPLRLNQVARAFDSTTRDKQTFWINGRKSVILAARKQPGANMVEVADRVKAVVGDLRAALPPGVTFGKTSDHADTVRESVADVNRTLLITIGLVVLVVLLFLGTVSSTLVAGATIPVSILGSFIVMKLLHYSVDAFSTMAITLSVGFIVDDAIVMIENIMRHREMGKSAMAAAIDGAREVSFTILSMTVSLVAVFLPVLFLSGVLGRLLREFAVTISVSILLSGVTSLTLTPMLCARFPGAREGKRNWFQTNAERLQRGFERWYQRSLDAVLRHQRIALGASLLMTIATIYLFLTIPKSFLPTVDVGSFIGTVEAAQNTSIAQMTKYGEQVNRILAKQPWTESYISGVESQNFGWFYVNLQHDVLRPSAKEVMTRLQQKLDRIPGLRIYLRPEEYLPLGQNESRSQYSAALEGPDAKELYGWAPKLMTALQQMPELANVSSDLQLSAPRIDLQVRRDLALSLHVGPEQIANTLYDAYGNRRVNTVTVDSERRDVILEVEPRYQRDPAALGALYIRSGEGSLVPLSTVAAVTRTVAPLNVNHVGQFPAVTFQFDLKAGVSLEEATQKIRRTAETIGLPATTSFKFQGTAAQFQSSLRGLGLLLVIAVLVIYVVLGVLYESFLHPITILSGLPPAAVGALLTLVACGQDLNLYSFLGVLLLIGIVKKNAIMIVDFALDAERTEGISPEKAIYQGCLQRLRPIMMTTMAAFLGAVPIAFANGVGGEVRRPLGIAVLGGLLVSQSLTLYVTPVVYLWLYRLSGKRASVVTQDARGNEALSPILG